MPLTRQSQILDRKIKSSVSGREPKGGLLEDSENMATGFTPIIDTGSTVHDDVPLKTEFSGE